LDFGFRVLCCDHRELPSDFGGAVLRIGIT
jgi:hypothetical protein